MTLESDVKADASDFKAVADSVFETLLTVTTILSGVYISITFGWFGEVMVEPHPGEPIPPEMLTQATVGIILGLIFILPLVLTLVAWAFSKFRNSLSLRTAAWSGLIYCLTEDLIGLVALFGFPLIAAGAFVGSLLIAAGALVILTPTIVGAVVGYRVGIRYSQSMPTIEMRKRRHAAAAALMVASVLTIQAMLGLLLFL